MTLRPPQPGDADALLALASDAEVTRWFSWGPYTDVEQPRAYIERCAWQRERGEQLDLLIIDRERGPAGITGLSEFNYRIEWQPGSTMQTPDALSRVKVLVSPWCPHAAWVAASAAGTRDSGSSIVVMS